MAENADQKMLRTGLAGSIVVALCCFTPILVLIVAGAGLSAVTGYLDYALFPMLFALLGVLAQALWLRAGRPGRSPKGVLFILAFVLSALVIGSGFALAVPLSAAAALAVAAYWRWLERRAGRAA
jgi:mercuric ion transport protein